jgi:hypothetical protein
VGYFNSSDPIIAIHAKCKREIKFRIAKEKAALIKEKNLFTSKLDLNLKKKLVNATLGT